jgi:hypothetical protein
MDELDDDIVDIQSPLQDDEDDIVDVQAAPTFVDRTLKKAQDFITPSAGTQELIDSSLEGVEDLSIGAAGGLTMNAADELGGLLTAGVETGLGALGIGPSAVDDQLAEQGFTGDVGESFLEKYRGYQQASQDAFKESEERSPVLNTVGQLGGGITSGIALGGALGLGGAGAKAESIASIARNQGKAKAAMELLTRGGKGYLKAAPAIAAESALTSEEQLLGPDARPMELAKDVGGGLMFGAGMMGAGQTLGDVVAPAVKTRLSKIDEKLTQLASESPLARQAKIAYETYGKIGKINPKSEKAILEGVQAIEGGTPFSQINTKRAGDITDKVLKADREIMGLTGQALDAATASGSRINAQDLVEETFNKVNALAQELPEILKDKNFNATMTKILSRNYTNASPREIKNAIEDITNSIDRISSYALPSPELQEAPKLLKELRKALDTRLKDSIPAYRDAAKRAFDFRRTYLEQPIAGRHDPDLDNLMYGDLKKGEKKLVEAYEKLVSQTTADSQSNENIEATYSKLAQATKKFEQDELARLAKGEIKAPAMPGAGQFMSGIKASADDAAVRRATRKTQESQGGAGIGMKDLTGVAQTGRGAVLSTSYLAGRAVSSKPALKIATMGRNLYNAPADTLNGLAAKLESNPVLSMFGKSLREGLENGDSAKKNAALFTIMQNPNARAFIEAEEKDEEEQIP